MATSTHRSYVPKPDIRLMILYVFLVVVLCPNPRICDSAESADIEPPIHIKVGYVIDSFSGVSIEDAKIAIRLIFETRFNNTFPEHKGEVTLFPDIQSAVSAIKEKRINGLGVATIDYLMTKDENNLLPVRNAKLGDSAKSQFVFLVRKEQTSSIDMLRNKSLLLEAAGQGNVAQMWLETLLFERSFPESRLFFKSVEKMKKDSQAVLKVFFGKADACIVQKSTYAIMKELNPQIETRLNVLYESPDYLMGILAVVKDIDEKTKNLLLAFIDELSKDKEGEKILSLFRVRGISEFKPESIESIESLYRSYLKSKETVR